MRVRHTETREPYSQPSVGFYRTIALSFLVLTVVLLGVVVLITSKKASITIMAKEDTRSVNMNVKVASMADGKDSIAGSVSSTVINFSQKYFPTGSKTIEGTAGGEVTLFNKTAEAQTLVKTTRLLTPGGVLFRLSDKVTVPANGEIKAQVYADKEGKDSNVGPTSFTIPGLATDKQKVIYAQSAVAMDNAVRQVGILTDADVQGAQKDFEQKIKDQYVVSSTDAMQKVVSVLNANPVVDKKVGDEVDGFSLSGTTTVVVVTYSKQSLSDLISGAVSSKVDGSLEKVLNITSDPKVAVASYDASSNSAQLSVNQDVMVTLDANAEKLSPQYFMGKTKDEIERYVFELDHVAGVQVDFTPGWSSKAPTVPDKIKIMVKDVK